ncbi:MAG: ATPase [Candidatus Melainabacteria bacterium HGW-Melainabacteria-1]|nr:MAG: ATPase [Candidatus Melainabacteria bacterium HGW-Melainabacteria-1]
MNPAEIEALQQELNQVLPYFDNLKQAMHRVIVGQNVLIERLLVALLADGHILLEGVPGLAKTLSISTLAKAIHTRFKRIQFTPDLLPGDVIGTRIFNPETSLFEVKQGPVFTNFLLADEINRAPPKVQSALLEAMQERQVTIGQQSYPLDPPFLVLATQNPLEQEGTYPLPEAQLDRFMLKVQVGYPSPAEEIQIIEQHLNPARQVEIEPVLKAEDILASRRLIQRIYVDDKIKRYIVDLVYATRTPSAYKLDLDELIRAGASPRASIYLAHCARVHAFLHKRAFVIPEDVKAMAMDILRHRLSLTYEAEAREYAPETIVQAVLDQIQVP